MRGLVLSTDTARPSSGATAVLIPVDFEQRGLAYFSSPQGRRSVPSDQNGRFEFNLLPPGRYLALAFSGQVPPRGAAQELAYLISLKSSMLPLEIGVNETKEITLKTLRSDKP